MHKYELLIGEMIEGSGETRDQITFACEPTAETLLIELHARIPFTIAGNIACLTKLQCWLNEVEITPDGESPSTLLIGTGPEGYYCDHRYDIPRAAHDYADLNYVGSV